MAKKFAINERSGFEFRAEAYDIINHPNLSGKNLNPTSSQFGMITSKRESRAICNFRCAFTSSQFLDRNV